MATVRCVEMPAGQSPLSDENAAPTESASRAGFAEWPRFSPRDLPIRPVGHRCSTPRIRPMDDPEILERVLEGLINLD